MCVNLIDDLKKSTSGLKNIKETYFNDIKFCCDIDTMLQMIDAKLVETKSLFPESLSSSVSSANLNGEEGDDL